MKFNFNSLRVSAAAFAIAIAFGCGGDEGPVLSEEKSVDKMGPIDPEKTAIFKVGDEIISIPSPVQTAFLLKKSGASYRNDILNSPNNISKYSTRFQKSINLGVYGADLGYTTIYGQTAEAISFINSTKKLAADLGVTSAFNPTLMSRFESNMGIQDSLLTIMGDAYQESNRFFQDSEQLDVGALVLYGGWIEALYFSTVIAKSDGTESVKTRIAEQKGSLENLIKLLQQNAEAEEIAEFVSELIELYYLFDQIESAYVWKEPTTDEATKTTTINSSTESSIKDEQINAISDKVESIRNRITG
tara:strand:- start:139 stop:1047 length:909 start_codon:yes stop_codon:yes gene_type:complete